MKNLKRFILGIFSAFSMTIGLSISEPVTARSCGMGCQQSMGSCTVNSGLWNAAMSARASGIPVTSCCRSPEYNARLRSCGYQPAVNSLHMSGRAIDLGVSPSQCNSRSLARYGFSNVCPLYHANHCHISMCGRPGDYQRGYTYQEQRNKQLRQYRKQKVYNQRYETAPQQQNQFPLFNFFNTLFQGAGANR